MSSLNKVCLIGNLGRDPETRTLPNGGMVTNLSLATSENWKDKETGERREKTEWHRITIFNQNLADIAQKYLRKGSKVYLEGQLQTRKWQQDGKDRYSTEVVLQRFRGELVMLGDKLPPAPSEVGRVPARDAEQPVTGSPEDHQSPPELDDDEDTRIPF